MSRLPGYALEALWGVAPEHRCARHKLGTQHNGTGAPPVGAKTDDHELSADRAPLATLQAWGEHEGVAQHVSLAQPAEAV